MEIEWPGPKSFAKKNYIVNERDANWPDFKKTVKVLVTGASGLLGSEVIKELERRNAVSKQGDIYFQIFAPSHARLEIRDQIQTDRYFDEVKPDLVFHNAAYSKVDGAEISKEECRRINIDGTRNLAEAAKKHGAKFLYISTDYVFDGDAKEPYETNDTTCPINTYGKTKRDGENVVKELLTEYYILRVSWLIGSKGKNFLTTMLNLAKKGEEIKVVCDQYGSPTSIKDLAGFMCDVAVTDKYGIYHVTNEGFCSWYELAEEIFKAAGIKAKLKAVTSEEYESKANRPKNSRLSKACLDRNGFKRLPDWKDAVAKIVEEINLDGQD
ncbi:MAG: dTDP-4-dehydrorhamnose reductase [Lachnospiraceae bacterium]|nr:dTDP-4-dehydrorhamnose reductase [Lachnospiraceae bacterium]